MLPYRWWSTHDMSVATRTAALLSLAIGFIFVCAALAAYEGAQQQSLAEALAKLDSYNRQAVAEQEKQLQRIVSAHQHASELFDGELRRGLSHEEIKAELDRMFPRQEDRTRRSSDDLFVGGTTSFGFVRGLGGFVGHEPSLEQARRLIAATRVVHAIGEGLRPELRSMSYFTPESSLVMFAPDRADKLLYYRRDAPATMTLSGREFLNVTLPVNNPRRVTRCTSLQPILYDTTGRTWTTGCMTPITVNGRFVGGWGSTILLDDLLAASKFDGLPDTDVILVSREGRLIRHRLFTRQNSADTHRYLDLTRTTQPDLKQLWTFLQGLQESTYLGHIPELASYGAIRRIPTSGWYAITLQSENTLNIAARSATFRVFVTAIVCLVLQAALLFIILRRSVSLPLKMLVAKARQLTDRVSGNLELQPQCSANEVVQLASSFKHMAGEVLWAHRELEAKVQERDDALEKLRLEAANRAEAESQAQILQISRLSALGAMTSTIAHEINQPLTASANFLAVAAARVGTLGDAGLDAALAISRARDQANRANSIIRRMRAFAKNGHVARTKVGPHEVVQLALDDLRSRSGKTEIPILVHIDSDVPQIAVDVVQVEQVIANLLRNAADALEGMPNPQIIVRAHIVDRELELRVQDNGPGLSDSQLEEVFFLFSSSKTEGLGLGLPLCRTLIEAHGGRIWAEHAAGGGAEFIVRLPISDESSTQLEPAKGRGAPNQQSRNGWAPDSSH